MNLTLPKGTLIILSASYCNINGCCDESPCNECIDRCNQFILKEETKVVYAKTVCDKLPSTKQETIDDEQHY